MNDRQGNPSSRPTFDPSPPELLLRITFSCNQKCIFCNTSNMRNKNLTCRDVLSACRSAPFEGMIPTFTGGEPTLHSDLLKMIYIARETGARECGIQTNAVLLSDAGFVRKLMKAGVTFAILSLHSHDERISDYLTGASGSFRRTIRGIRNLVEHGAEIIINYVMNSVNYSETSRFIEFVHEVIIEEFQYRPPRKHGFLSLSYVQPMGRAYKEMEVVPRLSEAAPHFLAAMKTAEGLGMTITNPGCGIPVCFTPGFELHSSEYQLIERGSPDVGTFHINMQRKTKGSQCAGCTHNEFCLGVWRSYSEMYGTSELRPVKPYRRVDGSSG